MIIEAMNEMLDAARDALAAAEKYRRARDRFLQAVREHAGAGHVEPMVCRRGDAAYRIEFKVHETEG